MGTSVLMLFIAPLSVCPQQTLWHYEEIEDTHIGGIIAQWMNYSTCFSANQNCATCNGAYPLSGADGPVGSGKELALVVLISTLSYTPALPLRQAQTMALDPSFFQHPASLTCMIYQEGGPGKQHLSPKWEDLCDAHIKFAQPIWALRP